MLSNANCNIASKYWNITDHTFSMELVHMQLQISFWTQAFPTYAAPVAAFWYLQAWKNNKMITFLNRKLFTTVFQVHCSAKGSTVPLGHQNYVLINNLRKQLYFNIDHCKNVNHFHSFYKNTDKLKKTPVYVLLRFTIKFNQN